jgi:hypothetical protein
MAMLRKLIALVVFGFLLGPGSKAKADSLVFESHSGSTYTYDLNLDYQNSGFTFENQILYEPDFTSLSITDLLGVTGVSVSGDLAGNHLTCTSTSSAVSCSLGSPALIISPAPETLGTISITSTAASGTVDYSVVDSGPDAPGSSGTVLGPQTTATVTPEPSTLLLLGTGLASVLGVRRRMATFAK